MFGELNLIFAVTFCCYKCLVKAWYLMLLGLFLSIKALNLSFYLLKQQQPSYMQCKMPLHIADYTCWTSRWHVHTTVVLQCRGWDITQNRLPYYSVFQELNSLAKICSSIKKYGCNEKLGYDKASPILGHQYLFFFSFLNCAYRRI